MSTYMLRLLVGGHPCQRGLWRRRQTHQWQGAKSGLYDIAQCNEALGRYFPRIFYLETDAVNMCFRCAQ